MQAASNVRDRLNFYVDGMVLVADGFVKGEEFDPKLSCWYTWEGGRIERTVHFKKRPQPASSAGVQTFDPVQRYGDVEPLTISEATGSESFWWRLFCDTGYGTRYVDERSRSVIVLDQMVGTAHVSVAEILEKARTSSSAEIEVDFYDARLIMELLNARGSNADEFEGGAGGVPYAKSESKAKLQVRFSVSGNTRASGFSDPLDDDYRRRSRVQTKYYEELYLRCFKDRKKQQSFPCAYCDRFPKDVTPCTVCRMPPRENEGARAKHPPSSKEVADLFLLEYRSPIGKQPIVNYWILSHGDRVYGPNQEKAIEKDRKIYDFGDAAEVYFERLMGRALTAYGTSEEAFLSVAERQHAAADDVVVPRYETCVETILNACRFVANNAWYKDDLEWRKPNPDDRSSSEAPRPIEVDLWDEGLATKETNGDDCDGSSAMAMRLIRDMGWTGWKRPLMAGVSKILRERTTFAVTATASAARATSKKSGAGRDLLVKGSAEDRSVPTTGHIFALSVTKAKAFRWLQNGGCKSIESFDDSWKSKKRYLQESAAMVVEGTGNVDPDVLKSRPSDDEKAVSAFEETFRNVLDAVQAFPAFRFESRSSVLGERDPRRRISDFYRTVAMAINVDLFLADRRMMAMAVADRSHPLLPWGVNVGKLLRESGRSAEKSKIALVCPTAQCDSAECYDRTFLPVFERTHSQLAYSAIGRFTEAEENSMVFGDELILPPTLQDVKTIVGIDYFYKRNGKLRDMSDRFLKENATPAFWQQQISKNVPHGRDLCAELLSLSPLVASPRWDAVYLFLAFFWTGQGREDDPMPDSHVRLRIKFGPHLFVRMRNRSIGNDRPVRFVGATEELEFDAYDEEEPNDLLAILVIFGIEVARFGKSDLSSARAKGKSVLRIKRPFVLLLSSVLNEATESSPDPLEVRSGIADSTSVPYRDHLKRYCIKSDRLLRTIKRYEKEGTAITTVRGSFRMYDLATAEREENFRKNISALNDAMRAKSPFVLDYVVSVYKTMPQFDPVYEIVILLDARRRLESIRRFF